MVEGEMCWVESKQKEQVAMQNKSTSLTVKCCHLNINEYIQLHRIWQAGREGQLTWKAKFIAI